MTSNCKGCGEELTSIATALSRYGHGEICSECGVREAMHGDFIKQHGSTQSLEYPAAFLPELQPAADERSAYIVYVERDQFADPQRFPDGVAWRSGILDENGEEIDGQGDIETREEAVLLAVSTLSRLLG